MNYLGILIRFADLLEIYLKLKFGPVYVDQLKKELDSKCD